MVILSWPSRGDCPAFGTAKEEHTILVYIIHYAAKMCAVVKETCLVPSECVPLSRCYDVFLMYIAHCLHFSSISCRQNARVQLYIFILLLRRG